MKEIIRILLKDIKSEDFTTEEMIVFGIIAPLGLVLACLAAEFILTI